MPPPPPRGYSSFFCACLSVPLEHVFACGRAMCYLLPSHVSAATLLVGTWVPLLPKACKRVKERCFARASST